MEIYRDLKKYRLRIFLVVLLTFGNAIGELFLPKLMSLVIDKGVAYGDTSYILQMGGVMIVVVVLTVICRASAAYHSSKTAMAFSRDIRLKIFTKINRFSFDDVEHFSISSLITRTTDDVAQVEQMVLMALRPLVRAPLMFIGGLIMALSTNLKLSGVFPITLPFIILGLYFVFKIGIPYFPILQSRLDKLNELFRRRLTGIRVIRAFSRDPLEEELFEDANRDYYEMATKVNSLLITVRPILNIVLNLGLVLVMYFGAKLIDIREMKVGELMAFIQYITQVLFSMIMISFLLSLIPRTWASMVRINEVLSFETTITGGEEEIFSIDSIEGRNLSFSYPGAKRPVLNNINFKINKGETIGIIGGIGSGKSSILKLLMQFYEPERGELFINNIDIRDINTYSLRKNISYVPQENFFFTKTVRENLIYGNPDATENLLRCALEHAEALEFLGDNPLDENVVRGGRNFSGGQRQRLAIARAIARNSDVYIFDDSFSALDYKTDFNVRHSLKEVLENKIVIIVAQRVATILNADKILVLEDGESVGFGSHSDLMKNNKTYREIVISQGQEEL